MSRPFSYHDKDMDVIGNILFIHCHIPNSVYPGVPMCKIPPEVLKRMTETRNVAFVTSENTYPVTPVVINGDSFLLHKTSIIVKMKVGGFIAGIRSKTFKELIIYGLLNPQLIAAVKGKTYY